jgi:tRNA A-37 threonylcarbamoyl transferase component Bud32
MDKETADQLLQALRDCGLYAPEQVAAAERAVATGGDATRLSEELFTAGVLTAYQARKVKIDRANEILFGPYLILDKIGEGGMGKVYKAVHARERRVVALKVVRPQLVTNRVVIRRYKREAAAAAALDHPNIVSLYEADEVAGRYYIAMEYVDGLDLVRMMKLYGRPPETGLPYYQEAAEYARQVALGLAHAHERGLVHRDIKPSNVLVYGARALPGTAGQAQVKILDMGLVRGVFDEDASRSELTRDGTVVGTPDYMAPEQAKNSSAVDPRADLYSLGCALYYMLKGQPPFPDGSPIDKLLRHQLDPPPDIRKYRPDVPAGLAAVIDRLLRKDPNERYQTAAEVAAALAPFAPGGAASVPVAEEQFVLAAHPGAVVAKLPARPPSTAVMPAPAPTASGPARVRVVRAVAAETAGRVVDAEVVARPPARVPGPTAVPRSDNSPSSGSLPGSSGKEGAKPTKPLASAKTASEPTRRRPPARARKRTQGTGPSPAVLIALLAVAVVLVIVATYVIAGLLQRGTGTTATGRKAETTRLTDRPTEARRPPTRAGGG